VKFLLQTAALNAFLLAATMKAFSCICKSASAREKTFMALASTPHTIDEYIAAFPPDIQAILKKIRLTIRKAVPQATERISYKMPAFFLNGDLIYFAAFKKHIGVFPPVRDEELSKELARYKGAKGNLKFPLDEPIPYALIGRLVRFRLREHRIRLAAKRKAKRPSKSS
jgi:uncharacterized protein YdhG (YjbR/CyaY superfamily)